jgi:tetratricopeptide (TPR) repeat protein
MSGDDTAESRSLPVRPRIVDCTYLLHEKLAEGGMGTVHRATRRVGGTQVALKLVAPANLKARSESSEAISALPLELRLRLALAREFQTLSSLHHPHVVQVLDYGFDDALGPYFTMELLAAPRTILDAGAALPLRGKVLLLAQVLRALAYVHRRGIIHRDLKPSNVLCVDGVVKVVDFGLATASPMTVRAAGTLAYMAPELMDGSPPSVASDLYAVGMIAGALITSPILSDEEMQFGPTELEPRGTVGALDLKRLDDNPDPTLSIRRAVVEIVRRLLAKAPEARYQTAAEVLVELSRATGEELPLETDATRESFLSASEFIGRGAELGRLKTALGAARLGRGSGWLVGGESGVGKSRLISELRTLALVEGACVARGQAVAEGGGSHDLWMPVLRALCLRSEPGDEDLAALKDIVPDLPLLLERPLGDAPTLSPAAAGARLTQAVEALFRRQTRPTVVVLEDLQWASPDSLALLGAISRIAATLRLLLVGTFRDDDAPTLPESVPGMRVMKLHRLESEQVSRLSVSMLGRAGARPDLVDYLCRETGGNLFFLVETVRALAEKAGDLERIAALELPEQMLAGGIERVARVSEGRALLEAAAVVGRRLDLALLEKLGGANLPVWLRAHANAAILDFEQGEWRFAHDQLRRAVLAHVTVERRVELHRQAAEAIEAVYRGTLDGHAAALAHHFEQAGEAEKAWFYRVRAGDIATRLCGYVEARRHYAGALALLARLPEDEHRLRHRVDTLLKQVYTAMVADSAEQNLARMAEARSALDRLDSGGGLAMEDEIRMARVNNVIGRVHFYGGQPREALACFRQVLPIAQKSGDSELAALPACLIGTALLTEGKMREAEPLLRQSVAPLERLGEPFEWFRAVGYLGFSLIAGGRYREGLDELARVHERARQIGQDSLSSAAHLMRGSAYVMLSGDWQLGIDDLSQVLHFASRTGDKLHLGMAWSSIGWASANLGRHQEATDCRAKAAVLAEAMGGRIMMADWHAAADAEIAFLGGEVERARGLAAAQAATSAQGGLLFSYGTAERVWGTVCSRQGDAGEADQHFACSLDALDRGGLVLPGARTRLWWARERRCRGEKGEAERLFDDCMAQLHASGCAGMTADAERLWAES